METMLKEKYLNYFTTEEFILDKEFAQWVMSPDKVSDEFWDSFLQEHPEKLTFINEASFIIKAIQPIEKDVPHQKLNSILQNIGKSDRPKILSRFSSLK